MAGVSPELDPVLHEEVMSAWDIFKIASPLARRYLCAIAGHPESNGRICLEIARNRPFNGATYFPTIWSWRQKISGFHDLEKRLRSEPLFAAHFLAMVHLPQATYYWASIVAGRSPKVTKSERDEAAKQIMRIGGAAASVRKVKPDAPVAEEKGNALRALMEEEDEPDDEPGT